MCVCQIFARFCFIAADYLGGEHMAVGGVGRTVTNILRHLTKQVMASLPIHET